MQYEAEPKDHQHCEAKPKDHQHCEAQPEDHQHREAQPNAISTVTVTIVVAIGENGVIGKDGDMPWPRTGDQKQFKALTMGHPIVMGRTTYESIGKPLPGRTSIVLTRNPGWSAEGVVVAHTLTDALAHGLGRDDEVFVIGGAQVYAEALEQGLIDRMVVTHVHLSPDGDAWFPALDWTEWAEAGREAYDGYDIATYDRV